MSVDRQELSIARAVWRPDPMLFGYLYLLSNMFLDSNVVLDYYNLLLNILYLQYHGIIKCVCVYFCVKSIT